MKIKFNENTIRKNHKLSSYKKSGTINELNDVQSTQTKIILGRVKAFIELVMVLKPACWYSSPYFNMSNQKWGTCQINKKSPTKSIVVSLMEPPAAVQPIYTGTAPTNEPGTTAKAVIRFSGV